MHLTVQQLTAHLTGALTGASSRLVEMHLQRCEACRSSLAMFSLQDDALAQILADEPGERFHDELLVEAMRHIDDATATRLAARDALRTYAAEGPAPADAEARAVAHAEELTRALVAELGAGEPVPAKAPPRPPAAKAPALAPAAVPPAAKAPKPAPVAAPPAAKAPAPAPVAAPPPVAAAPPPVVTPPPPAPVLAPPPPVAPPPQVIVAPHSPVAPPPAPVAPVPPGAPAAPPPAPAPVAAVVVAPPEPALAPPPLAAPPAAVAAQPLAPPAVAPPPAPAPPPPATRRRVPALATVAVIGLVLGCVGGGWWATRGVHRVARGADGPEVAAVRPAHVPDTAPPSPVSAPAPRRVERQPVRPATVRSRPPAPLSVASPRHPAVPATEAAPSSAASAAPAPAPRPAPESAPTAPPRAADGPRGLLCGSVVDEDGRPVVAAQVMLADVDLSIRTDRNGRFCLSVPSGERTLTVVCMGFKTTHQLVVVGRDTPEVALTLRSATLSGTDSARH